MTPRVIGWPGYDLESLLAVSVAVFNERGYDGTSMEDLPLRLGMAKSSIYHHVDSKEQLLSLALDGLFSVARSVAARDEPAIARLEYLVRESVAVLADRLPYVTLPLRARGNTATERRALAFLGILRHYDAARLRGGRDSLDRVVDLVKNTSGNPGGLVLPGRPGAAAVVWHYGA
jgi:AcrR family transcriptional regulator